MGTRPPTGIGSLLDRGVVQRGKREEQCLPRRRKAGSALRKRPQRTGTCSCRPKSKLRSATRQQECPLKPGATTCAGNPCTWHRWSCQLSPRMCSESRRCILHRSRHPDRHNPPTTKEPRTIHHCIRDIGDREVSHRNRIQHGAEAIVTFAQT